MPKKLFYFGCIGSKGHYWWDGQSHTSDAYVSRCLSPLNRQVIRVLDGTYPPGGDQIGGQYTDNIINNVRIVSWWDYSVDNRPGSNSNLIGIGYESAEEIIDAAIDLFPAVMKRQTRPIKFEIK